MINILKLFTSSFDVPYRQYAILVQYLSWIFFHIRTRNKKKRFLRIVLIVLYKNRVRKEIEIFSREFKQYYFWRIRFYE